MVPHYKELARQSAMEKHMAWRREASEKIAMSFGFALMARMFFQRPIVFDVALSSELAEKVLTQKPVKINYCAGMN